MGGAVKQMQAALADLQLWLTLAEAGGPLSIPPAQVAQAIGALEAGIAALTGETQTAEGDSPDGTEAPEVMLTVVDEDLLIQQIQESVIKQGVALPADIIALVLEAEEELLYGPDHEADEDEVD